MILVGGLFLNKSSFTANELEAIRRYTAGVKPSCSTFIDEVTMTYGYGELSDFGSWEFEIPHSVLSQGEPKSTHELMEQVVAKFGVEGDRG